MGLREVGYAGRTGIIAGVAGCTLAATEAFGVGQNDLVDTANWFGGVGLFWAGGRLALIGVGKLAECQLKEDKKRMQEVLDNLPVMELPVDPLRILSGIIGHERKGSGRELSESFRTTRKLVQERERRGLVGSYLANWSLLQDINIAAHDLAKQWDASPSIRGDVDYDAGLRAYEMSWLLDRAAPISPDCPRTPVTEPGGLYWADFIEQRARVLGKQMGIQLL